MENRTNETPKRKYEYLRNDASYTDKRMEQYQELKFKREMPQSEKRSALLEKLYKKTKKLR